MTTGEADALTSRAQGRLGSVLRGKYRLDRVLGVGGMAVVFKATHRNQAEFAVKMLHPELSIRDDVRTRFLREGYAANSVKHPGVVLVVDDDVAEDGAAFLVMEMLHGAAVETLWEHSNHRLPVPAVLSVADQLLDVLAAAHAKGIVHRDIKPANVFATRDGTVKVLDFGIARVRDVAGGTGAGHATGTGMMLGTPAFMAPEQAMAKSSDIDAQTDVWAVGATLFTLLSGQSVHEGQNAAQLMIKAGTAHARPLASLAADVPPAVAQVIDRALAFDKAARWPDAAAMREAIQKASLEAFGERPAKAALASLASAEMESTPRSAEELGNTATMQAPHEAGRASPVAALTPPAVVASDGGLPIGGSTAQPVSSQPELPAAPRAKRAGILAVAAIVVVLVGGGLVVRAAVGGRHEPPAVAAGVGPSAVPMSPVPSDSQPVTLSPIAPAVSATSVAEADAAAAQAPSANPIRLTQPAVAAAPARPPRAPAAAPEASSAQKPASNCNPDFYYDASGNKHFKPECFTH